MILEYPIIKGDCYYPLPEIGSKWIHKGGNVWQVVRISKVIVNLESLSGNGKTTSVNKGVCIFLKCTSGTPSLEPIHWPIETFREDFDSYPF